MIRKLFLLSFFLSSYAFGQEIPTFNQNRLVFWDIGVGLNNSTYRDFATSPLFYNGNPLSVQVLRDKISEKRETLIGAVLSGGLFTSDVQGHPINSSLSSSIFIDLHQLYRLKKFSNEKWNTKVGTKINTVLNFRNNPSLLNNSFGFEVISTLFGSVKVSRDISRKKRKEGSFYFINYSLPPRSRIISYQLNIGLVNGTYRNGYIYSNQSGVVNDFDPFYEYKFKLFSGYRVGSSFLYTQGLKNKNALRFGYTWDALRTGGDLDIFEMSTHSFTFSLLFNTR